MDRNRNRAPVGCRCRDEAAIHVYRREAEGTWPFDAIGGLDAELSLRSLALSIPLAEIYEFVRPGDAAAADAG